MFGERERERVYVCYILQSVAMGVGHMSVIHTTTTTFFFVFFCTSSVPPPPLLSTVSHHPSPVTPPSPLRHPHRHPPPSPVSRLPNLCFKMHRAFHPVPVVAKASGFTITAVATWDDKVFVGCSDRAVRVYIDRSSTNGADSKTGNYQDPSRMQYIEQMAKTRFCDKKIDALLAIPSIDMMVAVADGYFRTYNINSFKQIRQFEPSKGAYQLCANKRDLADAFNSTTEPLYVAVAMRRKIIVYRWEHTEFRQMTEIPLASSVRSMDWAGTGRLCVATANEYAMVQINNGEMSEVFSVTKNKVPCVTLLVDELMLTKASTGICVSFRGKPTRDSPIEWEDVPVSCAFLHPYVVGLLQSSVEVRYSTSGDKAQQFEMKGMRFVTTRHPTSGMVLASSHSVVRLVSIPLQQQIDELVAKGNFQGALQMADLSGDEKWQASRDERIDRLKTMFAYSLFNESQYEMAMMYFQQTQCDPRQVLALFPDVIPTGQCRHVQHPVPVENIQGEENLLRALSALIPYLNQLRSRFMRSGTLGGKAMGGSSFHELNSDQDEMPLSSLVDTVLLKAYLLTDAQLVMPFLQQGNECDVEESQATLRVYERYEELVQLYQMKGYHREALELLSSLGQSLSSMHPLYGTGPSVQYLQVLSGDSRHTPLVLEFSRWVLRVDPDEGLRIFTHAHSNPEAMDAISPHIALDHLQKCADKDIVMAYLESLVEAHDTTPEFHNELVILYLQGIMKQLETLSASGQSRLTVDEKTGDRITAGSEPGRLGILRAKLIAFLESSSFYTPEKMISKFPREDLLEERAILLSRIGLHAQALSIYAHKLRDPSLAEQYCDKYYDRDTGKDVYLSLLEVYLQPPTGTVPLVAPALSLLQQHYDRIDAARALDLLPGDTPIFEIMPFFKAVLGHNQKLRRGNQVIKHLRRSENLQVRESYLNSREQRIFIDPGTECRRCHKKIGTSAFARYPNGVVVHYICFDDKYTCPVTGQVFGPQ
jgi:Vam6/Vps39-like protein vacuolar protein sorting-associated protein 39